MSNLYYFNKIINLSYDETLLKVREDLQNLGFGIISEIDVTATFKLKLNVDFKKYKILGACHAASAFKALQAEDKIGTMLPCNIIVQETENGYIEIAVIDPVASMMAIQNEQLGVIAVEIREKLKNFIEKF